MQLMVPYVDEVNAVDSHLMGLAEFLGIKCETCPLDRNARHHAEFVQKVVSDRNVCFVVNPQVLERWVGGNSMPVDLVSCIVSSFPHVLVHGLRVDSFDASVIAALSQGRLLTLQEIGEAGSVYEFEKGAKDVCDAFSGLKFGPTNPVNDHVFGAAAGASGDFDRRPPLHDLNEARGDRNPISGQRGRRGPRFPSRRLTSGRILLPTSAPGDGSATHF
jgi:hypothetical protein